MNRGPEVNWRRQPVNAKCMHDIYDAVTTRGSGDLCGGYNCDLVSIRFQFDGMDVRRTYGV